MKITVDEFRDVIRFEEDAFQKILAILQNQPELVNDQDKYGFTPLMAAVSGEDRDPLCVKILLESGADVNASTTEGYTALHMFSDSGYQEDQKKTYEIANILKNAGAELEARTHWDWTPLMRAGIEGTIHEFRALLSIGCNPYVSFTERSLPACLRGCTLAEHNLSDVEYTAALIEFNYKYQTDIFECGEKMIHEAKSTTYEGKTEESEFRYISAIRKSMEMIRQYMDENS